MPSDTRVPKGSRLTPSGGIALSELAKRNPLAQAVAGLVFDETGADVPGPADPSVPDPEKR